MTGRFLLVVSFCLLPLLSHGQGTIFRQGRSELSSDPRNFLVLVKKSFTEVKKQTGGYPATWDEAWPVIIRSLPPYNVLTEDLHGHRGPVLTAYDPADGRTLVMTYRIRPVKKGFSVHSDSHGLSQDWIVSDAEDEPWWYFAGEKEELEKIWEKERILAGDASFIPGRKEARRERHIVTWKFYHRRAFDILFRYVKNPAEDYNFRISAVKALIQMPALHRFADRKKEIDRIIRMEMDIPSWDKDWRHKYFVELLRDLGARCAKPVE